MKKTFLFSAVAAAALLTACSQSDEVTSPDQETNNARKVAPITIRASYGNPGTRVNYDDNGSVITPSWEATDKLVVVYDGKTTELTNPTINGNVATFTGEISYDSNAPVAGTTDLVCYVAHSGVSITTSGAEATYTGQDGTLRGASVIYKGTGTYNTTEPNNFSFTAENALLKITASDLTAGEEATLTYKCNGTEAAKVTFTPTATTQNIYMAVPTVSTTPTSQSLEYKVGSADAVSQSLTPATIAAGASMNISKSFAATPTAPEGAINGLFSVSATKTVYFAKGNLQATYDGSSWTWHFAEHQWSYVGNAAGNTSVNGAGTISGTGTVDLFGFVGVSSGITGEPAIYGIHNDDSNATYGATTGETLKSDWGNTIDGSVWRTLTKDEWVYVFNTRTTSSGIRYAKATVNDVNGVILLPDDWSDSYYTLASTNTDDANFSSNTITESDWTSKLESHGAVFLPAAGYRDGSTVYSASIRGCYRSSVADEYNNKFAYYVNFNTEYLYSDGTRRYNGMSVRLVRNAN